MVVNEFFDATLGTHHKNLPYTIFDKDHGECF